MTLTGKGLVSYAKSKLGTPYFYGSKMTKLTEAFMQQMHKLYPGTVTDAYMAKARAKKQVGKVNVDCSGLIAAYTGKNLGSAQLYSSAKKRLSVNDYKNWADGVVVWRKGHVGVFFQEGGKYYVIEAKSINYGTVKSNFVKSQWSAGLTFSYMQYEYDTDVSSNATVKTDNPYKEPTKLLKKGSVGEDVKWLQWELAESGYNVEIDGIFGSQTRQALVAFQKSAKIEVDGIAGKETRKALIAV